MPGVGVPLRAALVGGATRGVLAAAGAAHSGQQGDGGQKERIGMMMRTVTAVVTYV